MRATARSGCRSGRLPLADDGAHTTLLTVADGDGWVVSATQTINSLFGARYMAPGKRVTSSMAPLIALRNGAPAPISRWTRPAAG